MWDVSMNINEFKNIENFSNRYTNIWESITASYLTTLIVPNDDACKQNMKQNLSVKAFNQGLIF